MTVKKITKITIATPGIEKTWKIIEEAQPETRMECFPPMGITRLFRHHFLWWPRPIVHYGYCCCCYGDNKPTSDTQTLTIDLRLKQNTFGPGRAIHIVAVPSVGSVWGAQYVAEWYMEWNASGGIGQLTVDLQVKRPNSSTFQPLASGLGPNDEYIFSTNTGGTYVFKATVRDSRGSSRSDTTQVTAPYI